MVKTRYLLIAVLALAALLPAASATSITNVVSPINQTYSDGIFNVSVELTESATANFTYSNAPANYSMSLINNTNFIYYNDSFTFTKGNFINFTFYAGNENGTDEKIVTINISNTVPAGNLSTISDIRNNETITINATVTDTDGIADVDSVAFYFTNDSATNATWYLIDTSTVPVGSVFNVTWDTTSTSDSKIYKIHANISDGDDVTEIVSNTFTIASLHNAPIITVNYPDGGETVSGTIEINWTTTDVDGDTSTVEFYYSEDSGTDWTQITGISATDDGSESWDTTTVGNDNNCRIKVIAIDALGLTSFDISDDDFTISNGGSGGDGDDDDDGGGTVSLGGGGLGDTAGYAVSRILALIEPGTSEIIEIDHSDVAFTRFTVNVVRTVGDVRIKVRDWTDSPTTVSPAGEIYQYLEIDTSNLPSADIATAIIEFKVPKTWFTENSANKESVKLKRYVSNGWHDLTTTYTKAEGDYYYYSANTPGFSFFAIVATGTGTATALETGEETGETPKGTGLFAGVTGGSIVDSLAGMFDFSNTNNLIGIAITAIVIIAFVALVARRKLGGGGFKFKFKLPDASGKPDKPKRRRFLRRKKKHTGPHSGKYVKLRIKRRK